MAFDVVLHIVVYGFAAALIYGDVRAKRAREAEAKCWRPLLAEAEARIKELRHADFLRQKKERAELRRLEEIRERSAASAPR